MKLIKVKNRFEEDYYINPEHITMIYKNKVYIVIEFISRGFLEVDDDIIELSRKLGFDI